MAISFLESWIFDGSYAIRGTRDTRKSRVRRYCVLQGLDDTIGSYNAALDFAQSNLGNFDPSEHLPRQTIRVTKMSGDKALVWVDYYRTPGLPDIDNLNAMERALCAPSSESVEWYSTHREYDSGNYPSTSWANTLASGKHTRTPMNTSVWRFTAIMTYGSSPLSSTIRGYRNKINSSSFDLGGVRWPQRTVRFDGPEIEPERIGAYTIYNVKWHFSVREDQWYSEQNVSDTTIDDVVMYSTAAISIPTGWNP